MVPHRLGTFQKDYQNWLQINAESGGNTRTDRVSGCIRWAKCNRMFIILIKMHPFTRVALGYIDLAIMCLLIPISSETKLGVFELPFVRWSVSPPVTLSLVR